MIVLLGKAHTFLANFGRRRTGKTVQYRLLKADLTEVATWTATGVNELGNGMYGVSVTVSDVLTKYIEWKDVEDSLYVADPVTVEVDWVTDVTTIKNIETGRWKVTGNQLILYDTDGTTPLYTFDLKDSAGNATESNPFERTPV